MLTLVKAGDETSFEKLVKHLQFTIRMQVEPFARDPALRVIEDVDSLFNIALEKVWQAMKDFKYDSSLSATHNERRFLAMVKMYIRNIMIDHRYFANIRKRCSSSAVVRIGNDECKEESQDPDAVSYYDPADKTPNQTEFVIEAEIASMIRGHLVGDEVVVFDFLRIGYKPDQIAGRAGIPVCRVNYVIKERIRPYAEQYV